MSFNVFPLGHRPSRPSAADPQDPAAIVDLAARRPAAAAPPMPDELWDELDAAAAHWQSLRAAGREVRFEQPPHGGRVRATPGGRARSRARFC